MRAGSISPWAACLAVVLLACGGSEAEGAGSGGASAGSGGASAGSGGGQADAAYDGNEGTWGDAAVDASQDDAGDAESADAQSVDVAEDAPSPCEPSPAGDSQCDAGKPPHLYRCIFPHQEDPPAGCVLHSVGDVTSTYCCP